MKKGNMMYYNKDIRGNGPIRSGRLKKFLNKGSELDRREFNVSRVIHRVVFMIGMILCGGSGKKLKPYTDNTPAPLVEIKDDVTILDKQLFDFASAGIDEAILLTGYKSDMIESRYGDK